ncbi:MAG: hypothetical protein M1834_003693 [Cirrosporium novae-zelandiae]|nr:MAG: hypothetical protein M1834_003693 [Cirrosporium novae-zelandiae]
MHCSTLIPLGAIAFARLAMSSYVLVEDMEAGTGNFFDHFDFFTDTDPTNGYVNYLSYDDALELGIILDSGTTYMGVDWTHTATDPGRKSTRIYSKNTYNHGLFILDLEHMPASICGTWPAFWLLGTPTWPTDGEMDIIEGVNTQVGNDMTGHTEGDCYIEGSYFTGELTHDNCNTAVDSNTGCQINSESDAPYSYGTNFNSAGGGVYAVEWTSDLFSIWHWREQYVPDGTTTGSPTPDTWGEPLAQFDLSCTIDDRFIDMEIVFDMTFCGDWAGSVWSEYSTCAALSSSCETYVRDNAAAFEASYWNVNSLQVFQDSSDDDASVTALNSLMKNVTATQILENGMVAIPKEGNSTTTRKRGARSKRSREAHVGHKRHGHGQI